MLKAIAALLSLILHATNIQANGTPSLDKPFQTSFSYLSHVPCVTLFYRDGRIGCGTTDRTVQSGKLAYYEANDWSTPTEKYVVVLEDYLLREEVIQSLVMNNKEGLLQGLLVLNSTSADASIYSPDVRGPMGKRTPSQHLNYGNSAYQWNSYGDGLSGTALYGYPLVYVTEMDVSDTLRTKSQTLSDDFSIVAEFNYYMGPDEMTSPRCLSWIDQGDSVWRPKCLPLGGTSVWATAGPLSSVRRLESTDKKVVMVATNIDSSSLFHDATPGINTAASNILALLMAAKLVGGIETSVMAGLAKKIAFGFFQGEAFGFLGSRAFLKDIASFECAADMTVPSVWKTRNTSLWPEMACLSPLRPSLEFQKLGEIVGMIAVDQVAVLAKTEQFYVHQDSSEFGSFVSEVLQVASTNDYSVEAVQIQADDDQFNKNDVTIPPTPLTSLLSITGGKTGGAVLTGYQNSFAGYYHSHRDTTSDQSIDLNAIATAATLMARAAVAAAYDDGSFDSQSAASRAITLVPELSSDDETMKSLQNCLFYHGDCEFLHKYAKMEQANTKALTGIDLGIGVPLGTPPNYYVSVYDLNNGQPFVQVGDGWFGAYTGSAYGSKDSDTFGIRPSLLEMSLKGMLNDFLGRPTVVLTSCKSTSDCSAIDYCVESAATCSGGNVCVCSQSHYHIAMDEALLASPNNATGHFVVSSNDQDISAMYTEPNWAFDVGVRVYRDAETKAGTGTLIAGVIVGCFCVISTYLIRARMVKELLY